jgi:hypothetical protein
MSLRGRKTTIPAGTGVAWALAADTGSRISSRWRPISYNTASTCGLAAAGANCKPSQSPPGPSGEMRFGATIFSGCGSEVTKVKIMTGTVWLSLQRGARSSSAGAARVEPESPVSLPYLANRLIVERLDETAQDLAGDSSLNRHLRLFLAPHGATLSTRNAGDLGGPEGLVQITVVSLVNGKTLREFTEVHCASGFQGLLDGEGNLKGA